MDLAIQQRSRRANARLRVRLPARMVLLSGTQTCTLTDLSLGGARVACTHPVKLGGKVTLMWNRFEAFGELVWITPGLCGIAFYDKLSECDMLGTRELDQMERLLDDRDRVCGSAGSLMHGGTRL